MEDGDQLLSTQGLTSDLNCVESLDYCFKPSMLSQKIFTSPTLLDLAILNPYAQEDERMKRTGKKLTCESGWRPKFPICKTRVYAQCIM